MYCFNFMCNRGISLIYFWVDWKVLFALKVVLKLYNLFLLSQSCLSTGCAIKINIFNGRFSHFILIELLANKVCKISSGNLLKHIKQLDSTKCKIDTIQLFVAWNSFWKKKHISVEHPGCTKFIPLRFIIPLTFRLLIRLVGKSYRLRQLVL